MYSFVQAKRSKFQDNNEKTTVSIFNFKLKPWGEREREERVWRKGGGEREGVCSRVNTKMGTEEKGERRWGPSSEIE